MEVLQARSTERYCSCLFNIFEKFLCGTDFGLTSTRAPDMEPDSQSFVCWVHCAVGISGFRPWQKVCLGGRTIKFPLGSLGSLRHKPGVLGLTSLEMPRPMASLSFLRLAPQEDLVRKVSEVCIFGFMCLNLCMYVRMGMYVCMYVHHVLCRRGKNGGGGGGSG